MLRSLAPLILVTATLLPSPVVHAAQKSTECYIPIGKSPGLSGRTVIGRVREINMRTRTMTITSRARTWTVELCDRTQIWLDRSAFRQPNCRGTAADCKPGLLCEIKLEGRRESESITCEWIKVQPARESLGDSSRTGVRGALGEPRASIPLLQEP